jgi:rod shape-determining protein MreC
VAVARRTGRSRFTLILLVLTSITLITLDFRGFAPLDSARRVVLDAFAPVGDVASNVFEPVGDAWNGAFNSDDLIRENEELRQRIDELEGEVTSGEVARTTNQQLLEQADLDFVGNLPRVQARVVSGAIGNFDTTIELDRGERDGIHKDMAVVTGRGLVGKVVRTSADRSVVELVSSGSYRVSFSIVGSNVRGLVWGHAEPGRLSAEVDVNQIVVPGQVLLTSGVQGSPYPQGLPIGVIADVADDDGTLRRDLDVRALASLSDVTYVSVVLWQPEEVTGP